MLAYDFDGVICPDIDLPWNDPTFDFRILDGIRDKLPPIFRPTGIFYIITGRPLREKEKTEEWCLHNKIYPKKIIYNLGNSFILDDIPIHKANNLNKFKCLTAYIESDPKQVEVIKQLTTKRVIHFSEFISQGFYNII